MFGFLSKNMCFIIRQSTNFELHFLRNPPRSSFLRSISTEIEPKQPSFTVYYLVNSCGLSPDSALSASNRVHFQTPTKADSVLASLNAFGFSQTQISSLITRYPEILVSNPEKTVVPKLDFFQSKGLSCSEIVEILCYCPWLWRRSLVNHIAPSYDYLKGLFKSDEKVVTTIMHYKAILHRNLEIELAPKIKLLRDNGVPELNIVCLLYYWPRMFFSTTLDTFIANVERVREMGFDPSRRYFIEGIRVFAAMSKSTWERKVHVLKTWGLSEEEIVAGFKRHPFFMMRSEGKIMAVMDFLVNQLGWESSFVAKYPILVSYSLEKRLVPRASVLQFLVSKGLVRTDYRPINIFAYTETLFLKKFVNCYEEAPELLKLYGEKLALKR